MKLLPGYIPGKYSIKNAVFWDVTPCGPCKNRRFGGTHCPHHQSDKNQRARNMHCASVTISSNVIPSSPILFALMMEAMFLGSVDS
jgi:hypothetical protein